MMASRVATDDLIGPLYRGNVPWPPPVGGGWEGVLLDYKARLYDSSIGRFIQPDTVIPNPADPQGWNRFAYVRNSPIMFVDPTGHYEDEGCGMGETCELPGPIQILTPDEEIEENYDLTGFTVEELILAWEEGGSFQPLYGQKGGLFYIWSSMFGKYWRLGSKNIKVQINRQLGPGVILCGAHGCRWVDYSTPGNILFGYAMGASGIPDWFYQQIGGFEQVGEDLIDGNPVHFDWCAAAYCDDPADLAAVQWGASLYEADSPVTLAGFQQALTTDMLESFQPPGGDFVAPFAARPMPASYQAGAFDQ